MIEIHDLSSGYGRQEIIHHVSASFEANSIISVIGPNGCGKSTLLKTLCRLIAPTSGQIRVDGQDIAELPAKKLAQTVAYLPQSRNIPNITAERLVLHGRFPYLSYPRKYTDKDFETVRRSLEALHIAHLTHKNVTALSGGERQKVYLAMALAQNTPYILLDEPATYLDIQCQIDLWNTLTALRKTGKSVITVTHDIAQALTFSDRIFIMDKGSIIQDGVPDQIYKSSVIQNVFRVHAEKANGIFYIQTK